MQAIRGLLSTTIVVGLICCTSGCATLREAELGSAIEEMQSPLTQNPPTKTEIAVACGLEIVRELASDGYFGTRSEAIKVNLDWHASLGPDSVQESTHLPNLLYVELLTEALAQLPEREEGLRGDSDLQLRVAKDGAELGTVEISVNAEGRYGITAIGFPATDSKLCEEHYVGDREG